MRYVARSRILAAAACVVLFCGFVRLMQAQSGRDGAKVSLTPRSHPERKTGLANTIRLDVKLVLIPVTVTDPEMTRYFMTIPEAVSLVPQAGAMADKRKVFELEMGQPVKIIELARQMIRLAGHRPDADIKIEIVGTRPGERLEEYLHDNAETVEPTWHPSIRSLTPKVPTDRARLAYFLDIWRRCCTASLTW